jgi:hypothetical protein
MPWYKTHEERLLNQTIKRRAGQQCWEWKGALDRHGYGQVGWVEEGKPKHGSAHRLSYRTFVGPIPDDLFVCHRCDNRKCIKPDHLFLGTHRDNMADAMRKGRLVGRPQC